jgi:hypothetical protein
VLLTQRNADRREDLSWERERARLEEEFARRRSETHENWLREQRLEAYRDLVRLCHRFWYQMVPLISLLERIDDVEDALSRTRMELFSSLAECEFLAAADLQVAIREMGDVAENVGHRPFQNERAREDAWRHELFDQASSASRRVEDAARAELALPLRHHFAAS